MSKNSQIIKRLVFSGGGAKGAVYPGAYAALEETGVFSGVEDIAGSSAGAFTAALLAVGMPTKEFQLALVGTNFSDMLGDMCETSWLTRDGKPLYNFLRKTIKNQVLTFLSNQELNDSHHCWPILQKLNGIINSISTYF